MGAPELLASALAEALELPAPPQAPEARLREHLRTQELLLVVDNLEHLLPAASLLSELLAQALGLKLLVTSREPLDLRGEWVLALEGLPYPRDSAAGPEAPREALELFAHAAARVEASFRLTPENEASVARLCRLVDGTPLGLELAAAWVPYFSCEELAEQLEQDLGFLSAPRDAPERHRSLRATFLHSWRLLSAQEQGVLRRLSVFRGGATLAAVEAVAGAGLGLLAPLLRKSLVRRTRAGRVELHELLRQFAAEALREEPAESARTHQRHAEHYTALLEAEHPRLLGGARQAEAVGALEAERDNVRSALRWALEQGRLELLARALEGYCAAQEALGRLQEAGALLAEAVAVVRPRARPQAQEDQEAQEAQAAREARVLLGRLLAWQARFALGSEVQAPPLAQVEEALALLSAEGASQYVAPALLTAGRLALQQGHLASARWSFHGSLAVAREEGERRGQAHALWELSGVASQQGQPHKARRLLARALAVFRELGDERSVAACLSALGTLSLAGGEQGRAEDTLREALRVTEAVGDPLLATGLRAQLAQVLCARGELAQAHQAFTECLRQARALHHLELEALALHGLGEVSSLQGAAPQAHELLEQALVLRQRLGARRGQAESLEALGRVARGTGEAERARACLRAALQLAMEVGSTPLVLATLVGLAEVPAPGADAVRRQRAVQALCTHPGAEQSTRLRAAALLSHPPPHPSPQPPRLSLSELVGEVLVGVGMA